MPDKKHIPLARAPEISRFQCKTIGEARSLARKLAARCPSPPKVEVGLFELLVNAVEHGNLEIGAAEKARLLEQDKLLEEIEHRLGKKPYSERKVTITLSTSDEEVNFHIKDEGKGFDWQHYFNREAATLNQPLGRGILLARKISFDQLRYDDGGTAVTATICLYKDPER